MIMVFLSSGNDLPGRPDFLSGHSWIVRFLVIVKRSGRLCLAGLTNPKRPTLTAGGSCARPSARRCAESKGLGPRSEAFDFGLHRFLQAAGLPIVTFSVPTPSTPHSTLSPGLSAATPAGVPVMMTSPA